MGDARPANHRPPHRDAHTAGKVPTAWKPKPMRKRIDTATAIMVRTTVTKATKATSMMYAISRRAQWFWTFLSSFSNSNPVGDWTPIVPRTEAPHFEQKAASSRSSLPHFQQYTKGNSDARISCRRLKLDPHERSTSSCKRQRTFHRGPDNDELESVLGLFMAWLLS